MSKLDQIGFCRNTEELDQITSQAKSDYKNGAISISSLQLILKRAYSMRDWVK